VANSTFSVIFPGCEVDAMEMDSPTIIIKAHTRGTSAVCPYCSQRSQRVHSYYTRTIHDLPVSEQVVCLKLCVRRFRCLNPHCIKRTFTERLPTLVAPYAQRTTRLIETLNEVGQALGGEAGARLLKKLRMHSSGDTLLRLLGKETLEPVTTPRVLGVDDWAQRKGHSYGTILVDLERHQVIDLLPDRTAQALAAWLQAHPGVAIVTRDRSTEYARGITEGAPSALQVADRWHLLLNLRQALERFLRRLYAKLKQLPRVEGAVGETAPASGLSRDTFYPRTATELRASRASHERRLALYDTIQQLRREGTSIRRIAEQLDLHRETVRTYYYAASFPERGQRQPMPSILDPYLTYLEKRHQEGCENATQLWREIRQQGYPGSTSQVHKWMKQQRRQPAASTPKKHQGETELAQYRREQRQMQASKYPSVKQLAWLLMKAPETLTALENAHLAWVQQDTDVVTVYQLAQQFAAMIRERQSERFDEWLRVCTTSGISCLETFALGITQDYGAVRAALETAWSNGQLEGQINRLKLLKRQMYGRASLELLRRRVLYVS
jgi:transposase